MSLRLAPIQIAAVALCLLMAALFVYELTAPPAAFALPQIHLKPRAVAMEAPAPFLAPAQSAFDAINDRPLFLPSRKALAAPATGTGPATAGPPPLPNAVLAGVILDGENSLAMVKQSGAPFAQAMRIGESLGGWTIAAIAANGMVLRAGTFTQDIHMDAKSGQPPAQPGTPPGSPGAPPSPPLQ